MRESARLDSMVEEARERTRVALQPGAPQHVTSAPCGGLDSQQSFRSVGGSDSGDKEVAVGVAGVVGSVAGGGVGGAGVRMGFAQGGVKVCHVCLEGGGRYLRG